MDLKQKLTDRALRLMQDPRVMRALQNPKVMQGLMGALQLRAKLQQNISGSQMRVIPKAGHYAVWEQPEEVGKGLRQFLDTVHGG